MNKWEDSFKRNEPSCYCSSNQGLFVPNRQLSLIVAGLLFLGFCTFMTGYFLGKKNVVEQFSEKIQKEAFADQVYTTVLANAQEQENDVEIAQATPQSIETIELVPGCELPTTFYYGQLIGFGTEKAAHLFVNKLASKGIDTEIKKRVSKTVKGRTSYWYQVVTAAYSNKNDLIVLVDKIAKEENIKDASICACPVSS